MSDIDANGLIVELVKEFSREIFEGAKDISRDALGKLKINLNLCLRQYLERNYDRYSKTKTLLYRERPVSIKNFYVRTDLSLGSDRVDEETFLSRVRSDRRIVVSGTAGSGKSTFCKSIFIELIESPCGIIPIFIELRHLNSNELSLMQYLLKVLNSIEPAFTGEQLEYALSAGKVLLIFDGFDEINSDKRSLFEKEIIDISSRFHKIMIIVSSRPDSRFSSWDEFYRYGVLPLSKEKAESLIGKLEYDQLVKQKFLSALNEELYEKHQSFASTPLLLTMMLLTYEQIAEIPNKIHLFYEQAFLTLFNKHDSLKSLYKRKSFSSLPLDEFKKVLSTFSVLSYSERKYYFKDDEIKELLGKAIKISDVDAKPEEFLNDLLDSVCIMQRDGVGYTFTHRSFQEYFTALFLVNFSSDRKFEIFDRIAFVNDRDDVVPMIYDINSDLIERAWVVPRLRSLVEDLEAIPNTDAGKLVMLQRFYSAVSSHEDDESGDVGLAFTLYPEKNGYSQFFYVLNRLWPSEFTKVYKKKRESQTAEEDGYERELLRIDLSRDRSISLKNIDAISEAKKNRLIKSGSWKMAAYRFAYAKAKLKELELKHNKKQDDLEALILGSA